jgi:hypothetical protein
MYVTRWTDWSKAYPTEPFGGQLGFKDSGLSKNQNK